MAISDADYHERCEDNRAYAARQVELKKVAATQEQTEELRELRVVLERLLEAIGDTDAAA